MRFGSALDRFGLHAGVALWILVYAATIALLLDGRIDARPYGVYAAAGARFLAREPLYELVTIDNFQYFPQAAILFSPFSWLGSPWGDLAFRALGWTLLALGVWRVASRLAPARPRAAFFLATCLTVGVGAGGLGNGQANMFVAAVMLLSAADLIDRRYTRAAATLALGLALKPLVIVMALLVGVLHRPMAWRLALALALVFVAPWLVADHAWVVAQYADCVAKLELAGTPEAVDSRRFEDLRGMLSVAGWLMPHGIYLAVRAAAAVGTLALAAWARVRLREPWATTMLTAFAAGYLMVFNARTMSTSYVILASIAAPIAASLILEGRRRVASAIAALIVACSVSHHGVPFVKLWVKPLSALVIASILVALVARRRAQVR